MFTKIYHNLEAYKLTNEEVLAPEVLDDLKIQLAYLKYWSNCEVENSNILSSLNRLDPKLATSFECLLNLDSVPVCNANLLPLIERLKQIDEELYHEEQENISLTYRAHELRKEWRKQIKEIRKRIRLRRKHKISYLKEWSKPGKEYISSETGEVHRSLICAIKSKIWR